MMADIQEMQAFIWREPEAALTGRINGNDFGW